MPQSTAAVTRATVMVSGPRAMPSLARKPRPATATPTSSSGSAGPRPVVVRFHSGDSQRPNSRVRATVTAARVSNQGGRTSHHSRVFG